jgi:hypothetical protein
MAGNYPDYYTDIAAKIRAVDALNPPTPEPLHPKRRWFWLLGLVALMPAFLVMLRCAAIQNARQIVAENRQIVDRRLKEFEGIVVRRPPYFDQAVEGDAWEAHLAVIARVMADLSPEELELLDSESPDDPDLAAPRKALVEKLEPRLKSPKEGLARTWIRPVFDWNRGLDQESFLLPNQLSFFRALAFVAREWRSGGREQDALELLSAGLAIAQDLSTNGVMIVCLVGEVNQERLRGQLRAILADHGLPGSALRELLRILGLIEPRRAGVAEMMDREIFCMKVSSLNGMEKVVDLNWGMNPMPRFYFSNRVLLADALRVFQQMGEDLHRLKAEPNLRQAEAYGVWTRHLKSPNPLVALLTPAIGKLWSTWKDGQVNADLARVASALACYQVEKGRYPESLGHLVPDYLPALPLDLFSNGLPLAYLTEGAAATVHSLGPDGDDDGGRAVDEEADFTGAPDGDLVWTVKRRGSP